MIKDESKFRGLTSKQQLLLRRPSRPSQQIQTNDRDSEQLYFQAHKKANKTLLVLGHLEIKNVPYISTIYALKTKHKVSIKSPLLVDIKSDKLLLS